MATVMCDQVRVRWESTAIGCASSSTIVKFYVLVLYCEKFPNETA